MILSKPFNNKSQGPNSIEKVWLEFWLEKSLEFWLEVPHNKKMFKIGQFRHVSESKQNLNPFFKPKLKPQFFY